MREEAGSWLIGRGREVPGGLPCARPRLGIFSKVLCCLHTTREVGSGLWAESKRLEVTHSASFI